MAQLSEECGAGTEVVENLNYSAQGLMNTWPSRFDAAKAASVAHDPRRIADEVYNGRMGNRPNSDMAGPIADAAEARSRDTTGRRSLGSGSELDLVNEPELVNNPNSFLEAAMADFVLCGCLIFAAQDDVSGVTYHLNGGYIGLAARTARRRSQRSSRRSQSHKAARADLSAISAGRTGVRARRGRA